MMQEYVKSLILLLIFPGNTFHQSPSRESFFTLLDKTHKARFSVVFTSKSNNLSQKYFITTNDKLYQYYLNSEEKDGLSYKGFLENLIVKQLVPADLTSSRYSSLIKENAFLAKEYKKYGLNYIMEKYLEKLVGEWRNKTSDQDINNTIIKIMVENYYVAYFSEHSGYYAFKQPLSFKIK